MGGENEIKLQGKAGDGKKSGEVTLQGRGDSPGSPEAPAQKPSGTQSVRVHKANGEIHFHADSDGLKAAMHVGDFYGVWSELEQRPGFRQYVDGKNNTILTLCTELTVKDGCNHIELYVELSRVTYGDSFAKLKRAVEDMAGSK